LLANIYKDTGKCLYLRNCAK